MKICADCIHFCACSGWVGKDTLAIASSGACPHYETIKENNAYYIGFMDGKKEKEMEWGKLK